MDEYVSLQMAIDEDGVGYVVDKMTNAEEITDTELVSLILEAKQLLHKIENYVVDKIENED